MIMIPILMLRDLLCLGTNGGLMTRRFGLVSSILNLGMHSALMTRYFNFVSEIFIRGVEQ